MLPRAQALIAARAREVLEADFAARKLVDFDGPHGFEYSAVASGRTKPVQVTPAATGRLRVVLPLLELRVPFELPLAALDDVDRGADDLPLDEVATAARQLAELEDRTVFYGVEQAGIVGLYSGSSQPKLSLPSDFRELPDAIAAALAQLQIAGVAGPYAIALDRASYLAFLGSTGPGGYPTLQHIRKLVDGPTVLAPSLDGALVVSLRGGDFVLTVGQDASVGYESHDREKVRLFLEETLTFRLLSPEAVVPLVSRRT